MPPPKLIFALFLLLSAVAIPSLFSSDYSDTLNLLEKGVILGRDTTLKPSAPMPDDVRAEYARRALAQVTATATSTSSQAATDKEAQQVQYFLNRAMCFTGEDSNSIMTTANWGKQCAHEMAPNTGMDMSLSDFMHSVESILIQYSANTVSYKVATQAILSQLAKYSSASDREKYPAVSAQVGSQHGYRQMWPYRATK